MKNWLVILNSGILCAGLSACGGGGGSDSPDSDPTPVVTPTPTTSGEFDYATMFTNLADNVIIPNYEAFKDMSDTLASSQSALTSYCDAIGSDDEVSARESAQAEWQTLMVQWQKAEMHNLGPAAAEASLLRNQIYAYDTRPFDSCRTDRAVVLAEEDGFDIGTRDFNSRGLDALEYILFEDNLNHTCTDSNPQTDVWDARAELERKQARCGYAIDVAVDINEAATAIYAAWIPSDGNYRETYIGNSDTHELILAATSDAMFYVEKDSKDAKVGVPLGFNDGCTETACPEGVESPFASHALENLQANVESFLSLYNGVEGLSFDDIISDADMDVINTDFADNVTAILDLIDTMLSGGDSISEQAQAILDGGDRSACENSNANPDTDQTLTACALHGLLKQLNDRLRTDFVTIIGVDLPDRVRGDTD